MAYEGLGTWREAQGKPRKAQEALKPREAQKGPGSPRRARKARKARKKGLIRPFKGPL